MIAFNQCGLRLTEGVRLSQYGEPKFEFQLRKVCLFSVRHASNVIT